MLRVENLKKYFPVQKSALEVLLSGRRDFVRAVDGVSFEMKQGEVLSLVGESGCGKTTTGRIIVGLERPTSGKDREITSLSEEEQRRMKRHIQMVFQDPYASLNPRMKIGEHLVESITIHGIAENE